MKQAGLYLLQINKDAGSKPVGVRKWLDPDAATVEEAMEAFESLKASHRKLNIFPALIQVGVNMLGEKVSSLSVLFFVDSAAAAKRETTR